MPKILKKINDDNTTNISCSSNNQSKQKIGKSIGKMIKKQTEFKKDAAAAVPLTETIKISSLNNDIESHPYGDYISTNIQFLNNNFDEYPDDFRNYAKTVCMEIVTKNLEIYWSDVYGAECAKTVLKEGIILPLEHPHLFDDLTKPWKSALLYGVPGTGKTLLAKALCTETFGKITFFNISPSTIISKWRGESEKIIRVSFFCDFC